MASHSVTLTTAEESVLPLRVDENGDPTETVEEYCQRQIDAIVSREQDGQRQKDFDSFDVATKDAMIAAEKAKGGK